MSSQTLKPESPSTPDGSIVDFEREEQKNDSSLRVSWSKIMDKGNYTNPSTYTKVEVLFLRWAENSDDLATSDEVNRLRSVFEEQFNYGVQIETLDNDDDVTLQVLINAIVAGFVLKNHGPNTLLIVYYAGHGRPGSYYGSLELFGSTSPNDKTKKRRDTLVWNKTEELLKPAGSDVLEIFDCCYAGNLGLVKGENRLFEYLAATKQMGSTRVPGPHSFTSALIYALKALLEEKDEGRFTTDELLRKIMEDAPSFPEGQTPVLSDREGNTSGRIMLHPLDRKGITAQSPSKESTSQDQTKHQTLTLHFDLMGWPSEASVEKLGSQFNNIFDRNTVGVMGVRWGGLRPSMYNRATEIFLASLMRNRRMSGIQQRPPVDTLLPVPSSPYQQFSSAPLSTAPRDEEINIQESFVVVTPVSQVSSEDSEDQVSDQHKKRKHS